MMIQFLLIALVFFALGRYSRLSAPKDRLEETVDDIVRKAKEVSKPKPAVGVLPFKTPEEFEKEKSGEAALERHWRESGIEQLVKGGRE